MYEKVAGSKRLAASLSRVEQDDQMLQRLARELHYLPDQLRQDIQAIRDLADEQTQEEKEKIMNESIYDVLRELNADPSSVYEIFARHSNYLGSALYADEQWRQKELNIINFLRARITEIAMRDHGYDKKDSRWISPGR